LIQCFEYIHILPLNNFGLTLIRNTKYFQDTDS